MRSAGKSKAFGGAERRGGAKVSRRQALRWTALLGAGFVAMEAFGGVRPNVWTPELSRNERFFGYRPFTQDLYLPPLAKPRDYGYLQSIGQRSPGYIAARGPRAPTGRPEDVVHGIAPEFGHCPD